MEPMQTASLNLAQRSRKSAAMAGKRGITVAIDGPAGAGKSTVAKEVARSLGYSLVDTGAIYRSVALLASRQGVVWDNDAGLEPIVKSLAITFEFQDGVNRVFLEGEDVTDAIRTNDISRGAAAVSGRPLVRAGLLELQRRLAGEGGAVLEGRDIGTVVFPEAPIKFFLDASDEERARRRYEELLARGDNPDYNEVLRDLRDRDNQDRGRQWAPLRAADDAVHLDSTSLAVDEVIRTIVEAVRRLESSDDASDDEA
jgi:cytidylate kinase